MKRESYRCLHYLIYFAVPLECRGLSTKGGGGRGVIKGKTINRCNMSGFLLIDQWMDA